MSSLNFHFINDNLRIAGNFEYHLFACGRTPDIGCGFEVGFCDENQISYKGMYFVKRQI